MSAEKQNPINIAVILLAAGNSSRLGHPKQLLNFKGKTLLQHGLEAAVISDACSVIVVLGAGAEAIKKEVNPGNALIVVNSEWQEGMASSIRCGIKKLAQINPLPEGVIIMVCDQPFVTVDLLNEMISQHQHSGSTIVACRYAQILGTPALFHKSLFTELLTLKGDVGAKRVINKHIDEVVVIDFPEGSVDMDTETDYQNLSAK